MIVIDGEIVDSTTQDCPAGNCAASLNYTFDTTAHSGGEHRVDIRAVDELGHESTRSFAFSTACCLGGVRSWGVAPGLVDVAFGDVNADGLADLVTRDPLTSELRSDCPTARASALRCHRACGRDRAVGAGCSSVTWTVMGSMTWSFATRRRMRCTSRALWGLPSPRRRCGAASRLARSSRRPMSMETSRAMWLVATPSRARCASASRRSSTARARRASTRQACGLQRPGPGSWSGTPTAMEREI